LSVLRSAAHCRPQSGGYRVGPRARTRRSALAWSSGRGTAVSTASGASLAPHKWEPARCSDLATLATLQASPYRLPPSGTR